MDESTTTLSSSNAEWPLWERDNCTLGRSFAATQTEAAEVKLLASEGGFVLLETEIQKWGMNLVSTVGTRKYLERNKFWCEQICVKLNCLFQVAVFHTTLGYRMDVWATPSAAGTRDFSHFPKRSDWLRPPTRFPLCNEGSFLGGKAAVAWSWPLICSQCWGIEWVELYPNCSRCLHDVRSHNFAFLLIQPQCWLLRGLMRFFPIVWCIEWLTGNISFVNGQFETRYM